MSAYPPYSDYIVYVDESGNSDMDKIDSKYPVFVLSFCVVKKRTYARYIVPEVQALKMKHWGHDMVILHSYEMRQKENDFAFLMDKKLADDFFEDMDNIMEQSAYILICAAIKKIPYSKQRKSGRDIYHMALQFCMERLHDFLLQKDQHKRMTYIVAESRNKKEDKRLSEEFSEILKNAYDWKQTHRRNYKETPMKLIHVGKRANSTGLQIADLVGHPVGHCAATGKKSRLFELLEQERKFFMVRGKPVGLKIFPK